MLGCVSLFAGGRLSCSSLPSAVFPSSLLRAASAAGPCSRRPLFADGRPWPGVRPVYPRPPGAHLTVRWLCDGRPAADMATFGRYTHAIVCRVPNSFRDAALGLSATPSLDEARRQHEAYVRTLRQLDVDVIELPADEKHPDCVFVEDCAVVCNGIALLCRPGHESRRGEVDTIRAVIKKELELPIVEVLDPKATLEGGDVLFTGREFFVGLSGRTNEAGAAAVAAAFPEFACTPVRVPPDVLHLKDLVTMAGPDILCVSETEESQTVLKRIEREATFRYQTLTVREPVAANCVFVNGTLMHRSRAECPDACDVFEDRLTTSLSPVTYSELAKANACLTCCSILIRKSKRPQL